MVVLMTDVLNWVISKVCRLLIVYKWLVIYLIGQLRLETMTGQFSF